MAAHNTATTTLPTHITTAAPSTYALPLHLA